MFTKHWMLTALFCCSGAFLSERVSAQSTSTQSASVSPTITYQGQVLEHGAPINRSDCPITVSLFTDELGKNRIWQDSYHAEVHNGIFTLQLGSGSVPLPTGKDLDRKLWIGLQVSNGNVMMPLTPFNGGAPFAFNIADSSITAKKMATDYISSVRVNGAKVTGKSASVNITGGDGIDVKYDQESQSVVINAKDAGTAGTSNSNKGTETLAVLSGIGNAAPSPTDVIAGGQANTIVAAPPLGTWDGILGGQGNRIDPSTDHDNIGGGEKNNIQSGSTHSAIGGGRGNVIRSSFSVLAGGQNNNVLANESVVGGGSANAMTGTQSVIGGGTQNQVSGNQAVITGGLGNINSGIVSSINGGLQNNVSGPASAVGGGLNNTNAGIASVIGGGQRNTINQGVERSVIGGGIDNVILTNSRRDVIGGGFGNNLQGSFNTIGGGERNQVLPNNYLYSTIGGGRNNAIDASYATIGGGDVNRINLAADASIIGGGRSNIINPSAQSSFIGGGTKNVIDSKAEYNVIGGGLGNYTIGRMETIGGGESNVVTSTATGYSFVGGGSFNRINNAFSGTISGGHQNTITATSSYGTIGGGLVNDVDDWASTIAGGEFNTVSAYGGTIGGGSSNLLPSTATNGFIGGGVSNISKVPYIAIAGGVNNVATGFADYAAIPGGQSLIAQSFGQIVAGFYNNPQGSIAGLPSVTPTSAFDDRLFIIGNGDAIFRQNAFEVSYNGHSIVYDLNGQGSSRAAIRGATYQDNTVYAWGHVNPGGAIVGDFGVSSVVPAGPGCYTITLNLVDPNGNPITLTTGSVTATIAKAGACVFISSSPITTNAAGQPQFTVCMTEQGFSTAGTFGCFSTDYPFMFKVCGQPK